LPNFCVHFVLWESSSMGVALEYDDHVYGDEYCSEERNHER
jgi:hypothetical protein